MMHQRRSIIVHRQHIALGILCVLLGALVIWRNAVPAAFPELPAVTPSKPEANQAPIRVSALPALSSFAEAAERPLFNPSRKRALEAVAVAQPQAAATRPFRAPVVLGIAGRAERRVALIRFQDEKDARHVRVGDSIDGWSVADIGKTVVIFQSGASEHEVRLQSSKEGGAAAAARR